MSNLLWRTKPAEPASHYLGGEAGRRCAEGGGRSAGRPAGVRRRGAPRSTPWPPCRCTSSLLSLRLKRFSASRSLCGVLAMRCYGPKWNGYCARVSPARALLCPLALSGECTRGHMLGCDWLPPYLENPCMASRSGDW